MKTLAYVVVTVLAPSEHAGITFVTDDPVVCEKFSDEVTHEFKVMGFDVMTQCIYTSAPVDARRPKPRNAAGALAEKENGHE